MLQQYKQSLLLLEGQRLMLLQLQKEAANQIHDLTNSQGVLIDASDVVKIVAHSAQQQLVVRLSGLVTECLQAVMGEGYQFQLEIVEKGGRVEFDMYMLEEGERYDPMDAKGGTVVDIITFALRVCCLLLSKDTCRVLVLDEPFRFVSKDLQDAVASLLERLSQSLGIQFIIVTHEVELVQGMSTARVFKTNVEELEI